jgi:hypothetical protein
MFARAMAAVELREPFYASLARGGFVPVAGQLGQLTERHLVQ